MKTLRHPPSKELWKFCMERLRELRGPDTRERDLANILGFEHSRAVRWKEGQMYVDRAEYLVRLADALDVEPMLMVALASGTLTVEQAHRQVSGVGKDGDGKRRRTGGRAEPLELASDASLFALDASKFDGGRGVVLLISSNGEGRAELGRGAGAARRRRRHGRRQLVDGPAAWPNATGPSWCSSTWASPTSRRSTPATSWRASRRSRSAAAASSREPRP